MKGKAVEFLKTNSKYILLSSFLIASLFNISRLILRFRSEKTFRYLDRSVDEFWYQYITHFLFCIIAFLVVAHLHHSKFFKGQYFSVKRIGFILVFLIVIILLSIKIHNQLFFAPRRLVFFGYIARYGISMALIFLIHRILILAEESRVKQEKIYKLEIEKVEAQHKQLKNQINPHFFFNTLNSLSGLVKQDAEKAIDYISYLSKIFRQSLTQQPDLVSLESEMEFLDYYIKLQKLRFGDAFFVEIEINLSFNHKQVLSMGLQTLLENALKHNTMSKESPLKIKIFTENAYVWMTNNYQPKKQVVKGENFGLSSLQKRSKWCQQKDVIIKKSASEFTAGLALT